MSIDETENSWPEIKILEPIRKYVKEFNNPDEFNLYYSKHKHDIDSLTTHKLNKMYHITGYRITKIRGVLMLKRWSEKANNVEPNIKDEIKELRTAINSIISYLNNSQSDQARIVVSPPEMT